MIFATHGPSRKCWPNLFRGRECGRSLVIVLVGAEGVPAPIPVFDLFDLLLTQAEVVANLMDQRFADDGAHLVLILTILFDRLPEESNPIGERVSVTPGTFWERRPLIEPVQRVGRLDFHLAEKLRARLVFDDERQVPHLAAETLGDERDRLNDESSEPFARHCSL